MTRRGGQFLFSSPEAKRRWEEDERIIKEMKRDTRMKAKKGREKTVTEPIDSIERISAGVKRGRPYVIRPPEADNLKAHRDHTYTEVLRAYGMHTLRITVALDAVAHTCRGTVSRWSGTSWELVFELPEDLAMAEGWQHTGDPCVEDFGADRDYLLSLALQILL